MKDFKSFLADLRVEAKKVGFWIRAAGVAAWTGGGNALLFGYLDPNAFNFSTAGLKHLAAVFAGGATIGLVKWVWKSPAQKSA